MATRRRAVSRSIITTRSSSSKTAKHKSERHEHQHQEMPSTTTAAQTQQEASSSTITTTTYQNQPCSPSPKENEKHSCNCKAEDEEGLGCNNCSTPKAKRFRIPEIDSCPPAPKKLRNSNNVGGSNCSSLRRSSMSFFTPPELTEFFFRVSGVPNMSTGA